VHNVGSKNLEKKFCLFDLFEFSGSKLNVKEEKLSKTETSPISAEVC
jgi:hypothetical protein